MTFDEAVQLARTIRDTPQWFVLDIEAKSGSRLEDDQWSVRAISMKRYREVMYWDHASIIEGWHNFILAWDRAVTHETTTTSATE